MLHMSYENKNSEGTGQHSRQLILPADVAKQLIANTYTAEPPTHDEMWQRVQKQGILPPLDIGSRHPGVDVPAPADSGQTQAVPDYQHPLPPLDRQ